MAVVGKYGITCLYLCTFFSILMPLVALCFCEVLQQLQHFKSGRRIFSGNYDLSIKAGKYKKKKKPYKSLMRLIWRIIIILNLNTLRHILPKLFFFLRYIKFYLTIGTSHYAMFNVVIEFQVSLLSSWIGAGFNIYFYSNFFRVSNKKGNKTQWNLIPWLYYLSYIQTYKGLTTLTITTYPTNT